MSNIGNKETMAKNIIYYLEKFGKTQRELAEVVGVSPSTFNDWTKGKIYPRIDKIEIMANYFGILKSDLIEEKADDEKKSSDEMLLTEDEKMLLDLFRSIPEEKKELALQMIRVALQGK